MFGLKRKHFVKVTQVGKEEVISDKDNTRMTGGNLEIQIHTTPDRAMGMFLAAMSDVAERFRKIHNSMPEPCDCAAIRFANSILRHVDQINDEMSSTMREMSQK